MSSLWVPLSQTIVRGLTSSTLLTRLCTPAMLVLPHQLKRLITSIRYRLPSQLSPTRMIDNN